MKRRQQEGGGVTARTNWHQNRFKKNSPTGPSLSLEDRLPFTPRSNLPFSPPFLLDAIFSAYCFYSPPFIYLSFIPTWKSQSPAPQESVSQWVIAWPFGSQSRQPKIDKYPALFWLLNFLIYCWALFIPFTRLQIKVAILLMQLREFYSLFLFFLIHFSW